jgi:hypothetical protein
MTSERGDRKPCTHAGCTGTMQYSREPLTQGSSLMSAEGEFGWVCSEDPGHFQFPSERPRSLPVAATLNSAASGGLTGPRE